MALSWSRRRKFIYSGVIFVGAFVFLILVYEVFFTAAPTCFDQRQNGTEEGIDCGGSCSLICSTVAKAPTLLWARSFPTTGNYYTATAYVQNPNAARGAGSKGVRYSFQLFDENNSLVVERDGVADLPPIPTVPILEPNVPVGNRTVVHTLFAFSDSTFVWNKVVSQTPRLTVSQLSHSNNYDKLSATLSNDTVMPAKNVSVVAVLFDADGVARASSKSTLSVAGKQQQQVFFTWSGGVSNIVRAEITVLPSF